MNSINTDKVIDVKLQDIVLSSLTRHVLLFDRCLGHVRVDYIEAYTFCIMDVYIVHDLKVLYMHFP